MPIASDNLIRRFVYAAASDGLQRRSLTIAAIVGTILNLINQGDSLWGAGQSHFKTGSVAERGKLHPNRLA
jgi:hypothetical protein